MSTVLGHECPKLNDFLDQSVGSPTIDESGQVDSNPVFIDYCPFCGVYIAADAKWYECPTCRHRTRYKWDIYSDNTCRYCP